MPGCDILTFVQCLQHDFQSMFCLASFLQLLSVLRVSQGNGHSDLNNVDSEKWSCCWHFLELRVVLSCTMESTKMAFPILQWSDI